ncbi:hypothetical protein OH76DRAFT_117098 [Lentinus brumalis]|uniref:F-box domain-containing protein n=1 Tax=Lentinus brumalis TaxID=2498619 RepID=A0A371DJF0_9APHY|nr:hypothetical protein OH76DRAFT_117098 [Polyporus brumalis]
METAAPLSDRDPTLVPLPADDAYFSDSDLDAAPEERRAPTNHLATVNFDVQNAIMSFLPDHDLSRLMRTSRFFLDIGLHALCARIPERRIMCEIRTSSLYKFLRVDAGSLSRVHLVEDIYFDLPYAVYGPPLSYKKRHMDFFLGILQSCRNLRRLRIEGWYEAIPASVLLNTLATSLPELEELQLSMFGKRDVEEKDLRELGRLRNVRKIIFKSSCATSFRGLEPLAEAVVELDYIKVPQDITSLRFGNVQKLGVRPDRSSTWLEQVTTVFLDVSELMLRPTTGDLHDCHIDPGRAEDDLLRANNRLKWGSACAKVWPLLKTIWAYDLCGLYCLGLPRRLHALSVPLELGQHAAHQFRAVVADAQPSLLELRVNLDECGLQPDGLGLAEAFGGITVPRLTLLIDVVHYPHEPWKEQPLLDSLARGLCKLSLTHLLIRYQESRRPISPYAEDKVASSIREYATILAQSSPTTLRWIGFDLGVWSILAGPQPTRLTCWEVHRTPVAPKDTSSDNSEDVPPLVTIVEMSASQGRRIMKTEDMGIFEFPEA